MRQFAIPVFAAALLFGLYSSAHADDNKDASAVIDKAVKALGGEEKLAAAKVVTWKSKGKLSFQGNESDFSSTVTVQGLDHSRQEFEGEFGGNTVKGVTIVAGDKGWRKFGENSRELQGDSLANQKRLVYLQVVAANVLPLKDKSFKIQSVTDEKVGETAAVVIKAAGPDGKAFQLYFDKESGLPIKQVATVAGRQGEEYSQEMTFNSYTDFDGIKRATKIESKRNGEKAMEQEITEFKVVEKADASAFAEP